MQRAGLGVILLATISLPAFAQPMDTLAARAAIVVAGGTDIVRILPPEVPQQVPVPTPPPLPPLPPEIKPPPQPDPPPPPPEQRVENAPKPGQTVRLRVRLGNQATDGKRPYLGANFDTLDRPLAIAIGLMNPSGALILETLPSSPAAQGGLRAGDVVVNFNGGAVFDANDLRQRIGALSPGVEVIIDAWRYVVPGSDFVATLRNYAEQGNVSVMYRLGNMYARGTGVARDEVQAVRWFRQAADAGNPQAMTDLALMTLDGRGTAQNTAEGLRLLKAAADTGNATAMWHYGLVLQDGKYVPKDLTLAAQMFQRAAETGFAPAMFNIALLLVNGTGVTRNYQEAARWYEKAVALGNAAAMVNLGLLYQRGQGVEKSDTRAAELYRRGAELNNVTGMHNLATLLDKGQGITRDSERAAELEMRALRQRYEFTYRQMTTNGANYSREFRMSMQRRLKEEGVYTGPIDGEFGQTTLAAITAFFNRKP